MKLIKLTKNGETKNNTKWEIGKTVSIDEKLRRSELRSDGVLHAFKSLEQALIMKFLHDYKGDKDLKIYEVEGDIAIEGFDKVGCYELTPIKEIPLPDWYTDIELRLKILVRFACYCTLKVIDIFEDKYSNNDSPRRAINEALKYGTDEFNADLTYYVAGSVRTTARAVAHDVAAYTVCVTAANVADVAAHAAYITADADAAHVVAGDAAYVAAHAAYIAADYHIDITELMQKAIMDFELN